MDINITIRQLIAALLEGDHDDAFELSETLVSWLDKGGFIPDQQTLLSMLEDLCDRYSP